MRLEYTFNVSFGDQIKQNPGRTRGGMAAIVASPFLVDLYSSKLTPAYSR